MSNLALTTIIWNVQRYTPTPRQTVSAPAFKFAYTIINNVRATILADLGIAYLTGIYSF